MNFCKKWGAYVACIYVCQVVAAGAGVLLAAWVANKGLPMENFMAAGKAIMKVFTNYDLVHHGLVVLACAAWTALFD